MRSVLWPPHDYGFGSRHTQSGISPSSMGLEAGMRNRGPLHPVTYDRFRIMYGYWHPVQGLWWSLPPSIMWFSLIRRACYGPLALTHYFYQKIMLRHVMTWQALLSTAFKVRFLWYARSYTYPWYDMLWQDRLYRAQFLSTIFMLYSYLQLPMLCYYSTFSIRYLYDACDLITYLLVIHHICMLGL